MWRRRTGPDLGLPPMTYGGVVQVGLGKQFEGSLLPLQCEAKLLL